MVQSSRVNLLTWECEPLRVDERCEKVFLPAPHPPPSKSTLSPRKRVILDDGFCDFAFSSAQNDRIGSIMLRMKVFKLET